MAIAVVLIVFFSGEKPKLDTASTDTATINQTVKTTSASQTKKETPVKSTSAKNTPNTPTAKPQVPAEYAEIFKETVDRPPPTAQIPILKPIGADQFPTMSFAKKTPVDSQSVKRTVDEMIEDVKKATTYIEKRMPDGTGASGSGFAIQADKSSILVATNFHVVGDEKTGSLVNGTKHIVVFNSGLPNEKAVRGQVIAADPENDLAILKVAAIQPPPTLIDPLLLPKLVETMDVRCFGYPLGRSLAIGNQRPGVSVTKSAISSLRKGADGKLVRIELNGGMLNHGNSGGPVVADDGRLVGVAVSIYSGTGISNLIPAHELGTLLTGRVFPPSILPSGEGSGQATFHIEAPISDPLGHVKQLNLHLWSGEEDPQLDKSPGGKVKGLPGATVIPLEMGPRSATGSFQLPKTDGKTKPFVILQIEAVSDGGLSGLSPPVRYQLVFDGVQTANDAIPLKTFRQNLPKYAGQTVVVRGKLSANASRRGAVYELQVVDDDGNSLEGVTFAADRDMATQLSELAVAERSLDARLTLLVAKQPMNGATAARITHVDFIGLGNRLVKSLPSTKEPTDRLIALNRAPEKFIGQTLTFPAYLSPAILGTDKSPELSVLFTSQQRPENLHFTSSTELAKQWRSFGSSNPSVIELFPVIVTARVEAKVLDGTTAQVVTVTRIEVVDPGGKSRVIE